MTFQACCRVYFVMKTFSYACLVLFKIRCRIALQKNDTGVFNFDKWMLGDRRDVKRL